MRNTHYSLRFLLLVGLLAAFVVHTYGQEGFITVWDTEIGGTSDNHSILIPTNSNFGQDYDYCIDWDNDGVNDTCGVKGDIEHRFDEPGAKVVRISGEFPAIQFNGGGDRLKLQSVQQWGNIKWQSMNGAFNGCQDLRIEATDAPILDDVTSMDFMFHRCWALEGDLSGWDVSNVVDMYGTFSQAWAFDGDLNDWDVSNVENMTEMFFDTWSFNSDLTDWGDRLGSCKTMYRMFRQSRKFNGDIDNWDISNVVDMREMFRDTREFDRNLGAWNVTSTHEFANMFQGANMSIASYEATLKGWAENGALEVSLGSCEGLEYCDGTDRSTLVQDRGWTIFDDNGPVQFAIEPLEPVRSGADGKARVAILDGVPPYEVFLNGDPQQVNQDTVVLNNITSDRQLLEIVDKNGCKEVYWFVHPVVTTICDFGSQFVSTDVWIADSMETARVAPQTLMEDPCVVAVFDEDARSALRTRTYIYEPNNETTTLTFETSSPGKVRAFVFSCEQFADFSMAGCHGYTDNLVEDEIEIGVDEPFYYIVIAGSSDTDFRFQLHQGQEEMNVCRAVNEFIECGQMIEDSVTSVSLFNTLDQESSTYRKCYAGEKTYTGGERVYQLEVYSPKTLIMDLESDGDMGLFVFNYDCANRCIFYSSGGDGPDSLNVTTGYYFIVVDQDLTTGLEDSTFRLFLDCIPLQQDLWPDRRMQECHVEKDSVHIVNFTPSSIQPIVNKFGVTNNSEWLVYLLTEDRERKIGKAQPVSFDQPFEVRAEADSIGDDLRCGYVSEESITYAVRMAERHETVYCTGQYSEGSGTDTIARFRRGESSTVQRFYQTPDLNVLHAEVNPPELPSVLGTETIIEFKVKANQSWWLEIDEEDWEWINDTIIKPGTGAEDGNIGTTTVQLLVSQNDDARRIASIKVHFKDGTIGQIDILQKVCPNGDCTTSSNNIVEGSAGLTVFPNPSSGDFDVSYSLDQASDLDIHLMDVNGRLIERRQVHSTGLQGTVHFSGANLTPGMYFVRVETVSGMSVEKLVIH